MKIKYRSLLENKKKNLNLKEHEILKEFIGQYLIYIKFNKDNLRVGIKGYHNRVALQCGPL